MTGTPKETSNANRPAPGLQLVCHLLSSANGTEFKYDVKISDFDDSWWDESATALVLGYRISTMEPDGAKEKGNMSLSDIRIELQADRPVKPKKSDGTNGGTKPRAAMDFGNGNGLEVSASPIPQTSSPGLEASSCLTLPGKKLRKSAWFKKTSNWKN
jgi:hypothetical protein